MTLVVWMYSIHTIRVSFGNELKALRLPELIFVPESDMLFNSFSLLNSGNVAPVILVKDKLSLLRL